MAGLFISLEKFLAVISSNFASVSSSSCGIIIINWDSNSMHIRPFPLLHSLEKRLGDGAALSEQCLWPICSLFNRVPLLRELFHIEFLSASPSSHPPSSLNIFWAASQCQTCACSDHSFLAPTTCFESYIQEGFLNTQGGSWVKSLNFSKFIFGCFGSSLLLWASLALWCTGLWLWWLLTLQSLGSRAWDR